MKKQIKYLLILAGLLFSASAEAQLPNQNMYLLRALNQHPVSQGAAYSALWGYRAPDGRSMQFSAVTAEQLSLILRIRQT